MMPGMMLDAHGFDGAASETLKQFERALGSAANVNAIFTS